MLQIQDSRRSETNPRRTPLPRRNRHQLPSNADRSKCVGFINHHDFDSNCRNAPRSSANHCKRVISISPEVLPPLPFGNDSDDDDMSTSSDQAIIDIIAPEDEGEHDDSFDSDINLSQPISIQGYALGQKGHPSDMKIEANPRSSQLAVSMLNLHDAAWIKRSDGTWRYAIVAEKITDGENSKLRFVVDRRGSVKTIQFNKYGESVRMIRDRVEAMR